MGEHMGGGHFLSVSGGHIANLSGGYLFDVGGFILVNICSVPVFGTGGLVADATFGLSRWYPLVLDGVHLHHSPNLNNSILVLTHHSIFMSL